MACWGRRARTTWMPCAGGTARVKAVASAVSTMVRQRRLPDSSAMGRVDADDNFAVLLRFANNALGSVHVSATAGHEERSRSHPLWRRRDAGAP